MTNNAYFYVLQCRDKSLYAGYTTNPKRRLHEHNQGTGAKYTRGRRPVKMIHLEVFASKSAAMKAENAFKKQALAKKLEYLKNTPSEPLD